MPPEVQGALSCAGAVGPATRDPRPERPPHASAPRAHPMRPPHAPTPCVRTTRPPHASAPIFEPCAHGGAGTPAAGCVFWCGRSRNGSFGTQLAPVGHAPHPAGPTWPARLVSPLRQGQHRERNR